MYLFILFFFATTHNIITYNVLNLLTKRYDSYSTYTSIQYFSRLLTLFPTRYLHYKDKVTLTL